jgi:pimeloyl-ACP methyl ester carboxylesterase
VTRRRFRIVFIALVCMLVLLGGLGAVFEQMVSARDRRDPPGTFVDVGGRRLHVICIGAGRRTVLFEPGGRSRSVSLAPARTAIAKHSRVCSYDRVGTGWSDDGPRVLSVGDLADDLRRLQENAPLDTPMIIVASSMGGLVAEMYARRFPDRVAGLVFVDAGNSEMLNVVNGAVDRKTRFELSAACAGVRIARPVGILRLVDSRPRVPAMLCAAIGGLPETIAQFETVPPLRADIPVVALSAETMENLLPARLLPTSMLQNTTVKEMVRRMRESHQHLAARSTRGSWRLVRGSGHVIAEDRPGDVVAAVGEILAQVPQP